MLQLLSHAFRKIPKSSQIHGNYDTSWELLQDQPHTFLSSPGMALLTFVSFTETPLWQAINTMCVPPPSPSTLPSFYEHLLQGLLHTPAAPCFPQHTCCLPLPPTPFQLTAPHFSLARKSAVWPPFLRTPLICAVPCSVQSFSDSHLFVQRQSLSQPFLKQSMRQGY